MRAEPKSKTRLPSVNNMAEGDAQGRNDKHCCVPLCTGNGRRHPELSFHQIPTKPEIRKAWIRAIRRDPGPHFKISDQTVVCSRHFKKEDFRWTPVRKTLQKDSVPSVFNWKEDHALKSRREIFKHELPMKIQKLGDVEESAELGEKNELDMSSTCPDHTDIDSHQEVLQQSHEKTDRIAKLEALLKEKEEEIRNLHRKLEMERFGIYRFSNDSSMILFYTGFTSMELFSTFFEFVRPAAHNMNSCYYKSSDNISQAIVGRQRTMLLIDELFMFLCRLRCGMMEQDLAVRFNCHLSTVSRKIITWANFLYFALGSVNIWPSRKQINDNMPDQFKQSYPSTRVIIDCTEIKVERPSSLALGSKCYSAYKSSHTWKGLVGIAPHGALTFVSSLYTGCMSDVEITKLSGLIDLMECGDSIMADKGFVLNKVLEGTGISVNIPPFLHSNGQFTRKEVEQTQVIAKLRIHIERHIRRVKEYHLFDNIIPLNMVGTINQLWTIANMLTLFKGPLVKEWK
ncbi:hypothetical protein FSP39_007303 [Pinctada imbricata]|uniref:THAP-type domain-containing protein n=1 Tax=Pinctada imbricata TaxID=66713 RepID=A0AA88YJZ6_PINIB|nr:hypothetical protein FSP39_007303 [Pinctada imbricata]